MRARVLLIQEHWQQLKVLKGIPVRLLSRFAAPVSKTTSLPAQFKDNIQTKIGWLNGSKLTFSCLKVAQRAIATVGNSPRKIKRRISPMLQNVKFWF
jgi:hypothetical protein